MSTNFSNRSFTLHNPSCNNWTVIFAVKISQMVVLSIILFFSLVGNTLVIIAVYKCQELKKTVNYFIVNMAVSDIVFPLTAIPVYLAELSSSSWQWPIDGTTGLIFCKLGNYVMAVSLTVSNLFNLFLLSSLGLHVSSTTNPIICFTFVESFRRGLREALILPQRKRLKTNAVRTREKEEVTQKKITALHEIHARI